MCISINISHTPLRAVTFRKEVQKNPGKTETREEWDKLNGTNAAEFAFFSQICAPPEIIQHFEGAAFRRKPQETACSFSQKTAGNCRILQKPFFRCSLSLLIPPQKRSQSFSWNFRSRVWLGTRKPYHSRHLIGSRKGTREITHKISESPLDAGDTRRVSRQNCPFLSVSLW